MVVYWKLVLDILLIISIIGALGFVALVKQKDTFMHMNIVLLSVLCFLYWLYLSSVRKKDLINWLEQNKSSECPCIARFRAQLKMLIYTGLPYWSLMYLNMVIICLVLLFPILMCLVAFTCEKYMVSIICTILAMTATFYISVIMICASGLKMRFRVEFNGGSLFEFFGVFLIFSNYGILILFLGCISTFIGLSFHYDIWKQYHLGVNIFIDAETVPLCNGNAVGRTQSPIPFVDRIRRLLWYMVI